LAAGGLAMIIPPSAMAIIVGTIGEISIRAVLIGGIVPGILLSIGFITYYVVRGIAFPKEAPLYDVKFDSLKEKLISFFRDVFPLSFLIFAVVGFIFIGFATPTESAAVGVVGAYIIAFAYRKMTWNIFEESLLGAVKTSGMILMIMAGAIGFSQFLSFTGAARELAILVTNLQVAPILIVIVMLIIVTIMGCFLEQSAILMIVIPLFMPLIKALEFDPVWFGILLLINVCLANLTPPFGLALFVLKGVAQEYSLIDIIRDSIPVVAIMIAITLLILFIPSIATWLPEQMF
ncbi:MAG: TRAP transporter large permease subunit, partial [Dethiobacteria bacterium]